MACTALVLASATSGLAATVTTSAQSSASHIAFANTGTLVGAAVFGNAGTHDGIAFSQWSAPFTTSKVLGVWGHSPVDSGTVRCAAGWSRPTRTAAPPAVGLAVW